jgi:hypothetical protein
VALLLHACRWTKETAMSKLETITNEKLIDVNGGRQTYQELTRFAHSHGFVVTSSTGGHHLGWAHKAGRAVDVRTRGHSSGEIRSFIRDARTHGITVLDERGGGNAAWTGPHLHLQK